MVDEKLVYTTRRIWSPGSVHKCDECWIDHFTTDMQIRPDLAKGATTLVCDDCAEIIRKKWREQNPPLPLANLPESTRRLQPTRKPPRAKTRR